MIKLQRPPKPAELTLEKEQALTDEYLKDNTKTVWRRPYIVNSLLEMSHSKCCYCEALVSTGTSDMNIDHFHCKKYYPQEVVAWENLLPSCSRCNRKKSSHDTYKEPIIDPTKIDPKNHLHIKQYRFVCSKDDKLARTTIDVLDLNDDPDLATDRFVIGNTLICELEEVLKVLEDNDISLLTISKTINKFKRALNLALPTEKYSALVATLILEWENYTKIKEIITSLDRWDEELQELEHSMIQIALL